MSRVDPPIGSTPLLNGNRRDKMAPWWVRWLDRLAEHANLVTSGQGSPEGVVIKPPGRIYLDEDGGAGATLWVKESGTGATGWVAK